MDKSAIFQLVIDNDPSWRQVVSDNWNCFNEDDKDRIEVLASGVS